MGGYYSDSDHFILLTQETSMDKTKLKIYILNKKFILKGSIAIRYSKQSNYIRNKKSEFDAESLAVVENELVLFSKIGEH